MYQVGNWIMSRCAKQVANQPQIHVPDLELSTFEPRFRIEDFRRGIDSRTAKTIRP